jgi:hypothetical protein
MENQKWVSHWIFIVTRNNSVEQVMYFNDFWEGAKHTDEFIKGCDPNIIELPAYNRGEVYNNGEISVGLYKG